MPFSFLHDKIEAERGCADAAAIFRYRKQDRSLHPGRDHACHTVRPSGDKSGWQSDWTSDFIRDSQLEKRVAKAASGEIIALGAYREDQNGISIFIVNMEAHPQSNPTLTDQRKYTGIGRMMIAYGIQLSIDSGHGGVVTFAAKTDELYEHYIQDFHAVPIFQPLPGGPKLLMLADEGAQEIFSTYLS